MSKIAKQRAVLVGVLAPQYLRYVEKSRIQADKTTFSEIVSAVKTVASTDEGFDTLNDTGDTVSVSMTSGSGSVTCASNPTLLAEVTKTLGGDAVTYKSKQYRNTAGSIAISVQNSEVTFTIVGPGYASAAD